MIEDTSYQYHLDQGNQAINNQQWGDAVQHFSKLLIYKDDDIYIKRCVILAQYQLDKNPKNIQSMVDLVNEKQPKEAFYYYEVAFMLMDVDLNEQALQCWKICVKREPDNAHYWLGLWRCLLKLHQKNHEPTYLYSQYKKLCNKAILSLEDKRSIVTFASQQTLYEVAITLLHISRANDSDDNAIMTWDLTLARIYYDMQEYARALEYYNLYAEHPNFKEFHAHEAATAAHWVFDHALSTYFYNRAQMLAPNDEDITYNRALFEIADGDITLGLTLYEQRWHCKRFPGKRRYFNFPAWQGQSLQEKHLFIYAEQGIGDHIMFGRFIAYVIQKGARITLTIDKRLERVFTDIFGQYITIAYGYLNNEQDYIDTLSRTPDYHVALASLLYYTRYDRQFKPNVKGYPLAHIYQYYHDMIASLKHQKKLVIGLSFCCRSPQSDIATRSSTLDDWLPILHNDDIAVINLQYHSTKQEIDSFNAKHGTNIIHPDIDLFQDVEDIFALLCHCDIFVSVPNSTVHFAALMHVPTWVVCPKPAPWQWQQQGQYCMWYDSNVVRLFRQIVPMCWEAPIEMVHKELQRHNDTAAITS